MTMFDAAQSLPLLERMRGNIVHTGSRTADEIDLIAEQVLVPLFANVGVPIKAERISNGWTLTITYPDADSTASHL